MQGKRPETFEHAMIWVGSMRRNYHVEYDGMRQRVVLTVVTEGHMTSEDVHPYSFEKFQELFLKCAQLLWDVRLIPKSEGG